MKAAGALKLLAALVLAAFFAYLAFGRLDWPVVERALAAARFQWIVLGLLLLAADYWVRIIRWWLMLRKLEPGLPLGNCAAPFLFSYTVNNLLPFRSGDLLRVLGFKKELQSPAMVVLGTLVIERLLDLMVLLTLFFIGLLYLPRGTVPTGVLTAALWLSLACAGAGLALFLAPGRIKGILSWLTDRRWLRNHLWVSRVETSMAQFLDTLLACQSWVFAWQMLALSGIAWGLEGAVFSTAAASLQAEVNAFGPWFALAMGTLATLLPSTPGYVGTFDYFTLMGLNLYGAERNLAAVFAVVVHILLWLPVTLAGAIALVVLKKWAFWAWVRKPE